MSPESDAGKKILPDGTIAVDAEIVLFTHEILPEEEQQRLRQYRESLEGDISAKAVDENSKRFKGVQFNFPGKTHHTSGHGAALASEAEYRGTNHR